MSRSRLLPGADSIEAALEASCATLVALERLRASAGADPHRTARLTRYIDLTRGAISELRRRYDESANPLAYGFVLGEAPDPAGGPGTDQPEVLVC
jgi:hypothetical protein